MGAFFEIMHSGLHFFELCIYNCIFDYTLSYIGFGGYLRREGVGGISSREG